MHTLLESYLSEVAAHLSLLPPKRRDEELREMRTHLENAVIVNCELGQSEDEAAQSAVTQFGTPQELGENVVWAWRRGKALNKRSLLGAAATTTLTLCLATLYMNYVGLPPWLNQYCNEHPGDTMALVQGVVLTSFGMAGLVSGIVFPKRAVRGVCLGLVVFWIGWTAVDGVGLQLIGGDRLGWILAALASAWAGSRSRLAWKRRGRPARR